MKKLLINTKFTILILSTSIRFTEPRIMSENHAIVFECIYKALHEASIAWKKSITEDLLAIFYISIYNGK